MKNTHLMFANLRKRMVAAGHVGLAILLLIMGFDFYGSRPVAAATNNPAPAAQISFTFDDGLASTFTNAQPILSAAGLTGSDYVITGCVGMTTVPNTCHANTDRAYMTWAQIQALQNTNGWEIGSHTVDHLCLASSAAQDPDDCQQSVMTTAQVDAELANSKSTLAAQGINATDFSPPYGDYNNGVLAEIAKYYATMRQFKNAAANANVWPYSDYFLQDVTAQEGVTPVSTIEANINTAIANKQWIVLTFHDIVPTPSKTADDWQYGTAELQQIATFVQSKVQAGLIRSTNMSQGLVTSTTNMLPNSNFAAGISGGWTTDAPSAITADSGNHGSYPNATNSVKLTSAASSAHLFSPKVAVNANTTYILKNYLNLQAITSGQVALYIDEYDQNGNWISGQYKTQEVNPFVEDLNISYKPTSAQVSQASLQVIVAKSAGITGYFANPQWFAATSTAPANMMPNFDFNAGISGGWTTDDPTDIKADANNNGSPNNPANSVLLTARATSANSHLFSPQIAVSSGTTYTIQSWINIKNLTSNVVGYYVDEYNSSGQWVSGKYMAGNSTLGAQNVGFSYTPTSSSVAKASLQVIVVGNSGLNAYFDDVYWFPR